MLITGDLVFKATKSYSNSVLLYNERLTMDIGERYTNSFKEKNKEDVWDQAGFKEGEMYTRGSVTAKTNTFVDQVEILPAVKTIHVFCIFPLFMLFLLFSVTYN